MQRDNRGCRALAGLSTAIERDLACLAAQQPRLPSIRGEAEPILSKQHRVERVGEILGAHEAARQ